MNSVEQELRKIEKIRDLRVSTLRRKQLQIAAEQSRAREAARLAEVRMGELEGELVQEQRAQLQSLTLGGPVASHRLVAYTKMQQRGVKQIKDAFQSIESAQNESKLIQGRLSQATHELGIAEKKLIGLQEALGQQWWKA